MVVYARPQGPVQTEILRKDSRMGGEKLLKQVFDLCKPITGNMPTTWCGSTRKLLFDLYLGHVWSSEDVGSTKIGESYLCQSPGSGSSRMEGGSSEEKQASSLSYSEEGPSA